MIKDDFIARFPNFDITGIDPVIENYKCYYNFDYINCNKEAILFLIAHLQVLNLDLSNGDGSVGSSASSDAIARKTIGGITVQYNTDATDGAESNDIEFFKTTKYGIQFLQLSRKNQGIFTVC